MSAAVLRMRDKCGVGTPGRRLKSGRPLDVSLRNFAKQCAKNVGHPLHKDACLWLVDKGVSILSLLETKVSS